MAEKESAVSRLTWLIWLTVAAAFAWVAYTHRADIVTAAAVLPRARLGWVAAAVAAIAGLYLCRAAVYRIPLRLFGYDTSLGFLWRAALGASALHQLLPVGGASGYAFLTYAMRQRGVSGAHASLMALLDTLSYAAATATIVIASLVYLVVGGAAQGGRLASAFAPGILIVAAGVWLYRIQRRRTRLLRLVLGAKNRIARLLGRRWGDAPVRRFVREYYKGKAIIGRRRRAFAVMLALQYLAVAADVVAVYVSCLALAVSADLAVVVIAFALAMSGMAVISAPGGGGSFETIMAAVFATHGMATAEAIAVTLLYRLVAFWLPAVATLFVLLALRRRRREIRRTAARA